MNNKDDEIILPGPGVRGRIEINDIRDNGSIRIKSRHSIDNLDRLAGYGFVLGYRCIFCNADNIFSDINEDYISCFKCGKSWTYQQFLDDLDFAIKEGEQQD